MIIKPIEDKIYNFNSKYIYEVEIKDEYFVVIEDAKNEKVGVIPKRNLTYLHDLFEPSYYIKEIEPKCAWFKYLEFGKYGIVSDYDRNGYKYDYDVEDCVQDEIKYFCDEVLSEWDTPNNPDTYKELSKFLVERYLRPFIEYGFLSDVQQKGDSGIYDMEYAPLGENCRGILLDFNYGESYYDDYPIIPYGYGYERVQGFSNWCHLSIRDNKFWFTLCGKEIELCDVDYDLEDPMEYIPSFLVYYDVLEVVHQLKDMQREYFSKEESK